MKKIIVLFLLSCMVFAVASEELSWTISEFKYPGRVFENEVGHFYAERGLDTKLGKLWPGSKVTPIQQSHGAYQVKFNNGQTGWVSFLNIKEALDVEITKECNLYSIDFLSGTTQMDKIITILPKGEIVTLYAVGNDGEYQVKTQKGKRGSVMQNYADPVTEKMVKEYNREDEHKFFFKENLDELTINKNSQELESVLGSPCAIVNKINKSIWYYTNVEVLANDLRYDGIIYNIQNDLAISNELQGEGYTEFIDKLPFYHSIKKNNKLNIMNKTSKFTLFENVRERHWILRILIRLLQIIIIVVFFSIARILAFQVMKLFALLRFLPNGIVLLLSWTTNLIFNYIYFIYLIAHVITEDYIFTAVVMLIMLVFGHRKISNRIRYHRCPACHLMWTAVDEGSAVVGKKHITENKSRTQLTNQYTNGSGQQVNVYTKFKWQEHMTEKQIKDYRFCANCGYRWNVERTETVNGHV